jgi:hypothetical protein
MIAKTLYTNSYHRASQSKIILCLEPRLKYSALMVV